MDIYELRREIRDYNNEIEKLERQVVLLKLEVSAIEKIIRTRAELKVVNNVHK